MPNPIQRVRNARDDERVAALERAARGVLRRSPVGRLLVRLRGRRSTSDLPADLRPVAERWMAQVVAQQDAQQVGLFDVMLDTARHSVSGDKSMELLTIPLALRASTVVELGCAMSYYDSGQPYSQALHSVTEGMLSTRLLGLACRLLRSTGTEASLHSVDIREWPERSRSIMSDLGCGDLWTLHQGADSVGWLQAFPGEIDVLLVDSNHTYDHVRAELNAAVGRMAARSAIIVDNCYSSLYRTGSSYMDDESRAGIEHGGEYGAVLEFLAAHPDWTAHWKRRDVMVMTRGWDLPTVAVPRS